MENSKEQKGESSGQLFQLILTAVITGYFLLSYKVIQKIIKADNFLLKRVSRKKRFFYFLLSTILLGISYYVTPHFIKLHWYFYGIYFLILPLFTGFLVFLFAEEIFASELNFKINKATLSKFKPDFKSLEVILADKEKIPVGFSFTTQKPIYLESKKRVQHMMISGGSGQGKSSLAITMRRHDLKHKRPIIDIDPKGSAEDIGVIRDYCEIYGRSQDFKHFNIADPDKSFCYNPLALGSVDERIEKMITVLDLENEFYRGFASNIFSIAFQCYDALGIEPNLRSLCEILINKDSIQEFFKRVLILPSGEYESLKKQIVAFKDFNKENILGIQAKVSRLNSPLFEKILNPSADLNRNLDLVSIVKKNQYAYFQLNLAQYKEVSKYLINFVLYDLKLICGAIDGGKLELNSDFLPVYIDEFASFGNEDFPEFLRVARSGRIGITVMFQSFASLDVITPVLKDEISTNTIYSAHFFSGSVAEIDYISMMPGTIFTNQRSFQVLGNGTSPTDDSKGTQFRSEEMKVDPNLYRELKSGQAAIYLKDKNEFDLMEIWHGKAAMSDIKRANLGKPGAEKVAESKLIPEIKPLILLNKSRKKEKTPPFF